MGSWEGSGEAIATGGGSVIGTHFRLLWALLLFRAFFCFKSSFPAFTPSCSYAVLRGRSAAIPQQEAERLGSRGALRSAPLHQAVRERLRSVQGLCASRGLRPVQVREGPRPESAVISN